MKVLHIIKGLGRGGAEMLLPATLSKHSPAYTFGVVYFLPHKNNLVAEIQALGVPVYCLRAPGVFSMLRQVPALVRLIKKEKYDLLHAHLPWSGIVGRIAARLTGVKIVYTEHNNFETYNRITRIFNKATFSWNTMTIAVSENALASLQKTGLGVYPLRKVLNGVDSDKFNRRLFDISMQQQELGLPRNKTIVATVAVFRRQKRLDRWVSLAASLLRSNPNMYFVIVGAGPEETSIKEQVSAAGIETAVRFTGLLQDPRPYLACAELYLMSSDFEGLPVALLESMSMGCVPVATAVGGIPDVITDNVNGLLYSADDPNEVVPRMHDLISDKAQMKSLSAEARRTVIDRYSVNRMVGELEDIYQEVAG